MVNEHSEAWNHANEVAQQEQEAEELAIWEEVSHKDMILFCIDAGETMYEINPETGKSYLHQALEGAFKVISKKLISSPNDLIGVLLFGTERTVPPTTTGDNFPANLYALQPIEQVGVKMRNKLKRELADDLDVPNHFREKFGVRPPAKWSRGLPGVIEGCRTMMKGRKAGTKRVFWITNNDNPYTGHKKVEAHKKCLATIRSAKGSGLEFDPFLISKPGQQPFQINNFYAELFQMYDDETADQNLDTADERHQRARPQWDWAVGAEDFESEILTRETPKRTTFSVRWEIGDEWSIGVKGYSTVQPAKRDAPVWFYTDEDGVDKQAISKPVYEDVVDGKQLNKEDRIKTFVFGQGQGSGMPNGLASSAMQLEDTLMMTPGPSQKPLSRVTLSEEEMRNAKTLGLSAGMKLIGMVDRRWLRPEDNIAHSNFLRPTDQELVGSTCAFAAILKYMLDKKKIAICLLVPRANVSPYFVALLPQDEEVDEHGIQVTAPGMHVIRLPFADDVREPPAFQDSLLDADPESVQAFQDIIGRLTGKRPYHPDRYPNPSLALHYTVLQRTAFVEDENDIPDPRDYTIPNRKGIQNAAGILIKAFKQIVRSNPESNIDLNSNHGLAVGEIDPEDVKKHWIQGSLNKLLVKDLESVCVMLGIAKTGRKAEKIIRIHNELVKTMPDLAKKHYLTTKEVEE